MKFFAAVAFIFVIPYLMFIIVNAALIHIFAVVTLPALITLAIIFFPSLISIVIGYWFSKGAPLPDN